MSDTLQAQDLLAGALLFGKGERGEFFYIIVQGELAEPAARWVTH